MFNSLRSVLLKLADTGQSSGLGSIKGSVTLTALAGGILTGIFTVETSVQGLTCQDTLIARMLQDN